MKQDKTHVNIKFQKINSKRERRKPSCNVQCQKRRENFWCWWLEPTRKRQLWAFFDQTKIGLIGTGDDWQCISISGDDARQQLSRSGVEREKMEPWRCWCVVVVQREIEGERDENLDFAKGRKAREGECLKIFPVVMLSNGYGALDLRERKRKDGGAVREQRKRNRV